jgi:signal transduction histidine kinase
MTSQSSIQKDLCEIADKLAARRDVLLAAWREAVAADPMLTSGASLPRRQLDDHIPSLLQSFEDHLRVSVTGGEASARAAEELKASEHGQQRWQQGFRLIEVVREWRHLQLCLQDEMAQALVGHSVESGDVARRKLTLLCIDGLAESAERYEAMERNEARNRLTDLEGALANYEQVERQRADAWREAAHDLRGNLGVVKTATAVLNSGAASEVNRSRSLDILHRGVESMHELLNELISLARLEAGREVRDLRAFDVAELCVQMCDGMHQVAEGRGLKLSYLGPEHLEVSGDAMKVRRIAQNLLVNALTYTHRGSVTVSVSDTDDRRWTLTIEDTGPGVPASVAGAVMVGRDATKAVILNDAPNTAAANPQPMVSASNERPLGGEGIGLSIVKRLCDLLEARLSLAPRPGGGSIFTVIFPKLYRS